jgi:hypothetical protein
MQKILKAAAVAVLLAVPVASYAQAPMPKPGPEHEFLKKDVGTWDAKVEMYTSPGAAPTVSEGTETISMVGPFWQVARFESQMMGEPFHGLGTLGYDPTQKKFVGTWIDSMTPGLSLAEGTYDSGTKTFTGTMEIRDMNDKTVKVRETTEWKDANTRVFTMYGPKGADGKEPVNMRISYKRRPAGTKH